MMELFLSEVPRLSEHAMRHNCRVKFLTSDAQLPEAVQKAVKGLEELSASCSGLTLNVCLSYGGRNDVAEACKCLARQAQRGEWLAARFRGPFGAVESWNMAFLWWM